MSVGVGGVQRPGGQGLPPQGGAGGGGLLGVRHTSPSCYLPITPHMSYFLFSVILPVFSVLLPV